MFEKDVDRGTVVKMYDVYGGRITREENMEGEYGYGKYPNW